MEREIGYVIRGAEMHQTECESVLYFEPGRVCRGRRLSRVAACCFSVTRLMTAGSGLSAANLNSDTRCEARDARDVARTPGLDNV